MVRQRRKHEENLVNLSLRSKVSKFSFIKRRSHEDNSSLAQVPVARPRTIDLCSLEKGISHFFGLFGVIDQFIYFPRLTAKVAVCPWYTPSVGPCPAAPATPDRKCTSGHQLRQHVITKACAGRSTHITSISPCTYSYQPKSRTQKGTQREKREGGGERERSCGRTHTTHATLTHHTHTHTSHPEGHSDKSVSEQPKMPPLDQGTPRWRPASEKKKAGSQLAKKIQSGICLLGMLKASCISSLSPHAYWCMLLIPYACQACLRSHALVA